MFIFQSFIFLLVLFDGTRDVRKTQFQSFVCLVHLAELTITYLDAAWVEEPFSVLISWSKFSGIQFATIIFQGPCYILPRIYELSLTTTASSIPDRLDIALLLLLIFRWQRTPVLRCKLRFLAVTKWRIVREMGPCRVKILRLTRAELNLVQAGEEWEREQQHLVPTKQLLVRVLMTVLSLPVALPVVGFVHEDYESVRGTQHLCVQNWT